jgi:transcription elongation factor
MIDIFFVTRGYNTTMIDIFFVTRGYNTMIDILFVTRGYNNNDYCKIIVALYHLVTKNISKCSYSYKLFNGGVLQSELCLIMRDYGIRTPPP